MTLQNLLTYLKQLNLNHYVINSKKYQQTVVSDDCTSITISTTKKPIYQSTTKCLLKVWDPKRDRSHAYQIKISYASTITLTHRGHRSEDTIYHAKHKAQSRSVGWSIVTVQSDCEVLVTAHISLLDFPINGLKYEWWFWRLSAGG